MFRLMEKGVFVPQTYYDFVGGKDFLSCCDERVWTLDVSEKRISFQLDERDLYHFFCTYW